MLRRSLLFVVGLALVSVLAYGCNKPKPAAKAPPAPANIEELKKAVADILTRTHVPGVGIALVSKDKVIWTGGVGKADLASGRDVDADTMFRIGSITKGFVALSILQLQAKGKISLDTKVADIAPEVPIVNAWEQTDPYLPILLRPAGEMKTSPNEMARFVRMMLNRGSLDGVTIVSPDSSTRMETETTTLGARNGFKDGYGLGNLVDVSP